MPDDPSPPVSNENAHEDDVRHRLEREVASWSADRSGKAHTEAAETLGAAVKRPATRTKSATKRAPKPAVAAIVVDAPRKPFSMSYDGVSSREYLQQSLVRRHT